MTPQERELISSLLSRLKAQGNQPKDAEAETLITRGMTDQPDAPYLLVQTVLIQDMALNTAQSRINELERQLSAATAAPPAQQPASFLGGAGQGSVPSAGPWSGPAPAPQPAAPSRSVWGQSAVPQMPPPAMAQGGMGMGGSTMMPGAGSGFLRQAATTAAGIAGGALLFQGIQSMFGPHYGGGFMSGTPMQPGISETVINNYNDRQGAPGMTQANASQAPDSADDQSAAMQPDPGQDFASDQDTSGGDFGGDDGNIDV